MGSPTISMQTAMIIQFIVVMLLLQPTLQLVVPHSTYIQYFGTNSLVNVTYQSYVSKFEVPVLTQANSTSGFGAASNLQNFSGLAFIYGAIGQFWSSLWNFPNMIYLIFTGMFSNITFIPASIIVILSILTFSYVIVGDFYKIMSAWMKSDLENIGQ